MSAGSFWRSPSIEHNDLAAGGVHAGEHGGALAGVLAEANQADAGAGGNIPRGGVPAAVVHENDLVGEAAQGVGDLPLQFRDVLLLVEEGNDDGELGRGGH